MSNYFTLILWTSSNPLYATKIINCIDPEKTLFKKVLFRNRCVKTRNMVSFHSNLSNFHQKTTKPLRNLEGLPLERTLILDNTPSNYVHNLRNAIPIVPYFGDGEGFTRTGRKFGFDHLK